MLGKKRRASMVGYAALLGLMCILITSLFTYQQSFGSARSVGWSGVQGVTIDTRLSLDEVGKSWYMPGCVLQRITAERPAMIYEVDACVVKKNGIELAASPSNVMSHTEYAIKRQGDTRFHYIFEFSHNLALLDDGRLVGGTVDAGGLFVVPVAKLEPYIVSTGPATSVKSYRIVNPTMIKDSSGSIEHIHRIDVSKNYLFAASNVFGRGVILVDLNTLKAEYVGAESIITDKYESNNRLAVSNDGKYVAVVEDGYSRAKIYVVDGGCSGPEFIGPNTAACYYIDFSKQLKENDLLKNTKPFELSFSADGKRLTMKSYTTDGKKGVIETQITPDLSNQRLDYLALGDSYSSGEGDIERDAHGGKYYRYKTDINGSATIPREKCHISTRSYPYLLARGMNLALNNPQQWNTIACSGATIKDVRAQLDTEYYRGQQLGDNGRGRLDGFSNITQLKTEALNEFIPGREKQIEFVKKYKPKVITLTMGGNDIGFGEKMGVCANPFSLPETCNYATPEERSSLKGQIERQYGYLKALYEDLYAASGHQAKIYALGYPQFISRDSVLACNGIAALNHAERQMIYHSVEYMNEVIKTAAIAAGVKYIDIEDSLNGHKLCDSGEKYVTGVVGSPLAVRNDQQESFHPNAKGHHKIAMAVWDRIGNESLLDYDICPNSSANRCPNPLINQESVSVPGYFEGYSSDNRSIYQRMMSSFVTKGSPVRLFTDLSVFRPNSTVTITIYSEPTHIGEYVVDASGVLDLEIVLPDLLPAGYHTLIVSGQTLSGEPVELEQVLLVLGDDRDDIDENGIADSQQACGPFMPLSEAEANLDTSCASRVDSGLESPNGDDVLKGVSNNKDIDRLVVGIVPSGMDSGSAKQPDDSGWKAILNGGLKDEPKYHVDYIDRRGTPVSDNSLEVWFLIIMIVGIATVLTIGWGVLKAKKG